MTLKTSNVVVSHLFVRRIEAAQQ